MTIESYHTVMNSPWPWALVIALGLVVGSFVNVLIWRLPRNESILRPRSRCPACGHTLRWFQNIPVFSWVFQRGRCGFCREPIRWVYPAVELICAGLFVGFFACYGPTAATLGFWYLSATLIAILFIDWEFKIIPNRLTYPAIVVGIAVALASPHITWRQSLGGAVGGLAAFVAVAYVGQWLFKKDSLGGGDIKLAAALGAFLGIGKILLVFVLSAAVGMVVSLVAMAFSPQLRRHRVIPYGPFLATAGLIAGFWGDPILQFYYQILVP